MRACASTAPASHESDALLSEGGYQVIRFSRVPDVAALKAAVIAPHKVEGRVAGQD